MVPITSSIAEGFQITGNETERNHPANHQSHKIRLRGTSPGDDGSRSPPGLRSLADHQCQYGRKVSLPKFQQSSLNCPVVFSVVGNPLASLDLSIGSAISLHGLVCMKYIGRQGCARAQRQRKPFSFTIVTDKIVIRAKCKNKGPRYDQENPEDSTNGRDLPGIFTHW